MITAGLIGAGLGMTFLFSRILFLAIKAEISLSCISAVLLMQTVFF